MIKTLKRKFIFTAMAAVTVLLAVLLSAINIFNAHFSSVQSKNLLEMLTGPERVSEPMRGKEGSAPKFPENQAFFTLPAPPAEDEKKAAVYFAVISDSDGNITQVDVSRISSVSEEEARGKYERIKGESGKIDKFIYKTISLPEGGKKTVFLSTANEFYSVLRIGILSLAAGLVYWWLMFLIVVVLSKKAIAPVEDSMEKQKKFITDAGHEIKTPLAIISANAEALELHSGASKWSENIKRQTARLNGLMQSLLSLARLESQPQDLKKEYLLFSKIVEETVNSFEEPAKLRELTVKSDIDKNVFITADGDKITGLVSALLDNSVKYASAGSEIFVSLKKGSRVSLKVRNICDELPDCPPETLFDRFYRGSASRTQKEGGYGIGLACVMATAQAFGGGARAEYLPENVIEFTVELP